MNTEKTSENRTLNIIIILLILVLMFMCFKVGTIDKQNEIEARIWPHQKDCYNEQDLEIIVFGEIQE